MSSFAIGGQGSGDFRETSARVQIIHVVTRNTQGALTPDAFTQANPPVVTNVLGKSATLANVTKVGVLGGSVAFSRPDYGNGFHGGPNAASYAAGCKPLGIFLNDAIGNAFENTPGVASGKGPYVCGSGTVLALSVYETKSLGLKGGPAIGTALTYAAGDKLYASANGLVTNNPLDAYEYSVTGADTNPVTPATLLLAPTVIGVVKVAPDANSSLLVIDLRV
jgi:hypothetical protein